MVLTDYSQSKLWTISKFRSLVAWPILLLMMNEMNSAFLWDLVYLNCETYLSFIYPCLLMITTLVSSS
jgi:hypothetical protein